MVTGFRTSHHRLRRQHHEARLPARVRFQRERPQYHSGFWGNAHHLEFRDRQWDPAFEQSDVVFDLRLKQLKFGLPGGLLTYYFDSHNVLLRILAGGADSQTWAPCVSLPPSLHPVSSA